MTENDQPNAARVLERWPGVILLTMPCLAVIAALATMTTPASAQCEVARLDNDADAEDHVGFSVAISGDVAVVGAPADDENGPMSGSAYVFRFDPEAPPDARWVQEARLLPSDGQTGDRFGWSVALEADTAIVGAFLDDELGVNSGSAYVFRRRPEPGPGCRWVQQTMILAPDGDFDDRFGFSVDLSGPAAVIGAYRDEENGDRSGSAYVFVEDPDDPDGPWLLQDKLLGPVGYGGAEFGRAVAIEAGLVVVGAEPVNEAYVFRLDPESSTWMLEAGLDPWSGLSDLRFGAAVEVGNEIVVVGAPATSEPGTVHVFAPDGSTWVEQATIKASDGTPANANGIPDECEDCNENGVRDDIDIDVGNSEDCNGNRVPDECDIADGTSGDMDNDGIPDECQDCNGNGVPDSWDINFGDSTDVNHNGIPDECEPDCNGNGYPDDVDILLGWSEDEDRNGVPDECEIPGDLDRDTDVDSVDLALLLSAWGPCERRLCPADLDGSGHVDAADLAILLANWST